MTKVPILTDCDANCNVCGMNRVCTASGYNMNNYYEKWQQAENK